jgi:Ca2+-binding RTX toxin-like protein
VAAGSRRCLLVVAFIAVVLSLGAGQSSGAVDVPSCRGVAPTVTGATWPNRVIKGTPRDDVIVGNGHQNLILAGKGDDLICGRGNDDLIAGQGGDDALFGQGGHDILLGMPGEDLLSGGAGKDRLNGGEDFDRCDGGDGQVASPPGPARSTPALVSAGCVTSTTSA